MADTETATDGETVNLPGEATQAGAKPVSEQPREGKEVLPASTRRMIQEELHAYEPRLREIIAEAFDAAFEKRFGPIEYRELSEQDLTVAGEAALLDVPSAEELFDRHMGQLEIRNAAILELVESAVARMERMLSILRGAFPGVDERGDTGQENAEEAIGMGWGVGE
jgi:hypothetical protein